MTLDEGLRIAAQAVFLWVAFSTLLIWLQSGDRTRRTIFLVFLSFGVAIIAQDLLALFPSWDSVLTPIFYIAVLTQSYLVLRVARSSVNFSALIPRIALAGLLIASISIILFPSSFSTILMVVYFLMIEGYATYAFFRGAGSRPGLIRRRLTLAAIGSTLMVLTFMAAVGALLWSEAGSLLNLATRGLTILSGISYYLGFASPRWLRRAWQLEELHSFLHELSGSRGRSSQIMHQLAEVSMRALLGAGVAIARPVEDGCLMVEPVGQASFELNHQQQTGMGDIKRAWQSRHANLVNLPDHVEPEVQEWAYSLGAKSLYLAPIIGSEQAWGLLTVALRYLPLFAQDDLDLLQLFCEQGAIHLDEAALVEKLENANQQLERRVLEQSRSEERIRRLLESAPDGMVIIDGAGIITMSNDQAGRHFGYRPEELVGRRLESLFPASAHGPLESSHAAMLRHPPERPQIIPVDLNALRRDGSRFPVEVSLNPLLTSEGILTIVAVHDLTRRFHAEQKFRGLLESAPDAVVVVDKKGLIQIVNSQAEKMFGYDREEMFGQSIEMLVPRRFQKKHIKHRDAYYVDHPARPMGAGLELFAVRKNGTEFPVEISLSPLEFEDGLLVSAAIRDVTQRKEAEEKIHQLNADLQQRAAQLEAANKELESFSYSVSHDLRAPLRSIDGFSQALLEDFSDKLPEEGRGYLQRVRSAAQRMADLIDDLLNLSRVTRASLMPRFMNLSQVAEETISRLREQDSGRKVEVSIIPDMMVTGDPHLLQIVMENLLSNAWKFTSKRELARIEFGQQNHSGERTFYVRDNGVGFNMAYVDKLFGVFQRLHSVSDYPGTGVGLATVQRIIRIHGGRIWAESSEGKGTTFYFTL